MKEISKGELMNYIHDKDHIMIGGFMTIGAPVNCIKLLAKSSVRDLTVITNDTGVLKELEDDQLGVGFLVKERQVKKLIASHIGLNAETGRQMIKKEMNVELVPQGTLVERIHAGGAGLGGILTPTGVGTVVAEGKRVIEVNNQSYLLEEPLRANVALIKAKKADKLGNLIYEQTARNFNPLMAMAADIVIAEVDELVEVGELLPEEIITPFILVDKILVSERGGKNEH